MLGQNFVKKTFGDSSDKVVKGLQRTVVAIMISKAR